VRVMPDVLDLGRHTGLGKRAAPACISVSASKWWAAAKLRAAAAERQSGVAPLRSTAGGKTRRLIEERRTREYRAACVSPAAATARRTLCVVSRGMLRHARVSVKNEHLATFCMASRIGTGSGATPAPAHGERPVKAAWRAEQDGPGAYRHLCLAATHAKYHNSTLPASYLLDFSACLPHISEGANMFPALGA